MVTPFNPRGKGEGGWEQIFVIVKNCKYITQCYNKNNYYYYGLLLYLILELLV
jgi:hypothetical protein